MTNESKYINKQIGNYHVIRQLGSGASGCVYLAQHTLLTQRIVAIKLLHATHLSSSEEREDFLREAQILEELKHPYILPIVDVGIEDGFPYIVAEYASNGSLRDRIKIRAPSLLPLHEILTILTQIGQALSYAHQQHIIHRDIKPENILFNAKNEALLADFGLATSLSTGSVKCVDNAGTPRYMPPEQFQGHVSKESDQYGLACIAYELVTGHQPFIEKDFYALGFKHLTENPIPPTQLNPYLPVAVEQVILKAMAKQRADRYPDIASFIAALAQAASFDLDLAMSSQTQIPTLPSSNVKENSQDGTLAQTLPVGQSPTFINRIPITPLPPLQEAELVYPSHSTRARKTLPAEHDALSTSHSRGQADKQRAGGVDGHASTNAPAVRSAGNLTGSSSSLAVKRGSSNQCC
jgi:serine/threonine protein kinase